MSDFLTQIEQALADPLGTAHTRAAGRKLVGIFGAEVPVELVDASGKFALRLPVRADAPTPRADLMLESSFMPQARSVAEQYLGGELGILDALLFPRSDDSAQRLYYYLCEHQRTGHAGPALFIYDLAKIPRATSQAYSRAATQRLADALGAQPAALDDAIAARDRRRALFARAQARRSEGHIRASDLDRIARAAGSFETGDFDAQLSVWIDAVPATSMPAAPRIVLAGSAPPDGRLHRAVEEAGGQVIAEFGDYPLCACMNPGPIGTAAQLSDAYQRSAYGARACADRAGSLAALAAQSHAQGVILWLIEEEESLIWDLPAQSAALSSAGIAQLTMSRRRWDAQDGALAEIAAFVKTLTPEMT